MAEVVIEQAASTLLDRLVMELRLVGNVGRNVEDAVEALQKLLVSKTDLGIRRSSESPETRPAEVANWLKRVEQIQGEIDEVKRDYGSRYVCAGCFSPNIFSSYAISRRAVEMLDGANDLLKKYEDSVKNIKVDVPAASCILKPAAGALVGKSQHLLAQLLSYVDSDDKADGIISICGMAGIGKSELLRRLNNQFLPDKEKAHVFKLVIWVRVDSSDVSAVQDELAKRLKLGDLGPADQEAEARAGPIFSVLKDASFLVLLDNLMAPVSLAAIGIPNPVCRYNKSDSSKKSDSDDTAAAPRQKVVLTTRFKGVCEAMNSFRRVDVECLDWDASWTLFTESMAQKQWVQDREIGRLAEQVARGCGGLPIALEKIGRYMSDKVQNQDWRTVAGLLNSSRIHQIPGMEKENTQVLRDLKESYDHLLSAGHKERFLCCALWPRGGSISKAELVDCWIGLGLIRESTHERSVEHGLAIIRDLQDSTLLLPGENAESQVKLQEVVRDMALWETEQSRKWVVEAGVGLSTMYEVVGLCQRAAAAERVSLMYNFIQGLPQSDNSTATYPSLALLMLQHNPTFTTISGAFLRSASDALEYLDLSHTAVEELPEELGTLAKLRYLNLSFTRIKALPGGLKNLGRLEHLFLKHTDNLSTIPVGVFRGLTSLRVIHIYPSRCMDWEQGILEGTSSFALEDVGSPFIHSLGITVNSILTVQRLGRLANVCTTRLLMTRFDCPPSATLCPSRFEHLMGSFSLLESLQELSITKCRTLKQLVLDGEEEKDKHVDDEEDSWCLPNLEHLELCELPNLAGIIWKRMSISSFFKALLHVKIKNCSCLTNVSWVIQLPFLQILELHDCATMESVVVVDGQHGQERPPTFHILMTLVLVNLPLLSSICTQQVSFPHLQDVRVDRCPNLRMDPSLQHYYKKASVV